MNDDRLIFNTLNHWIFGDDYTGDVTNVDNMIYLIEKCAKLKPILLVINFLKILVRIISLHNLIFVFFFRL